MIAKLSEAKKPPRPLWQQLALIGPAFVVGAWQFGPGNLTAPRLISHEHCPMSDHPNAPKLVDSGFHKSAKRGGDCENLILCQRGQRNYRMIVETLFSGWVRVLGMKSITERGWSGIESHLAFACAT